MDTTIDTGLSREHLKALRNADTIVAHHYGEAFKYIDAGEGRTLPATWFECIKEYDPKDGFGKRDIRVSVPVEPASLRVFTDRSADEGEVMNDRRPVSHAVWLLYSRFSDSPAHTLVHDILRVGDRITPKWTLNNNNDIVREAGLTVDEFSVEIIRGPLDNLSKCKRLTVMLDSVTIKPHSSARNVTWA